MSPWPCRRLGDCGEILAGGTPSRSVAAYWRGEIPWISAKSLKSFRIYDSEDRLTTSGAARVAVVQPGAVLFVVRGMSLASEFRIGIAQRAVAFNQDLRAIRPSAAVHARFLARYLKAIEPQILSLTDEASHGTKRLTSDRLAGVRVPVPPLAEQRRIADILDRADAIRTKRREAIALLDTLPESIFIEMFGDPATSGWRWRRRTLASACASQDDIRCGPFGTQLAKHEFRSDGVPLLGIKNVNAAFELPPWEFLDERTARRLSHYSIEPGDIVMTRKGTVGNCSVYPHGRSVAIMHSDLLRIRPSPIEFEAGFLAHQPSVDTAKPTFNRHLKIDNC